MISRLLWFRIATLRFPALGAGYIYLLQVLIGSLDCLSVVIGRVITLVLVLTLKIRSNSQQAALAESRQHLMG